MTFLAIAYLTIGVVLSVDFHQWLAAWTPSRRPVMWEYVALVVGWLPMVIWVAVIGLMHEP